ncbi:putative membrane protein YccC [Leeuwenhoekiella aestuarii]|uniref:Putative membrane protein YccC n=1 Tax=Leeuwenhoekiella aestuarii TaxID=2249426 RepID=A0A4V1KP86_9FLAO|nr:putative membrane protein YccC [Leeuwenhoekiella aestuarii]RXG18956.1 putative membrane protein YccC [Leeuwenhoekiella aestuarii]
MITAGLVIPILTGYLLDALSVGLAIGTGVMFSSPSTVTGSLKNKRIGIVISAVLGALISLIGSYIPQVYWVQLPYLGISMFALSLLSVYGFRASLIGFAGLFAVVLSFANLSASGLSPVERSVFILIGGIWYLILTLIHDFIAPKKQIEELLETAVALCAGYIEARGEFLKQATDRDTGLNRLFTIQSEFNEHLEKLREILLINRHASGTSSYYRKRFLILGELVDLSELSLTSPIPPRKMHDVLKNYPEQLEAFIQLNKAQSESLKRIAHTNLKKHDVNLSPLDTALKNTAQALERYLENNAWDSNYLVIKNLYELQEKQAQRILSIADLLDRNKSVKSINSDASKEAEHYITRQDYSFQLILQNLNRDSPIFRHALRIAVTAILGFGLGSFFDVQNPYWILLTIVVIMRPGYGLTKQRSKHRIIGTLLGAAVATGIVYVFQDDKMLFRILAILSFILAQASLQKNYRTAALFITLSIIFAYALLKPDVLLVIQYRVIDTALGVVLAALANAFLWPTKEAKTLKQNLAESLTANRDYLKAIEVHYETKEAIALHYKMARKKAFLATAALNAGVQRLLQEPKRTEKLTGQLYELAVLNHAFIGGLASIGTYLRGHNVTRMDDAFHNYTAPIYQNMDTAIHLLEHNTSNAEMVTDTEAYFGNLSFKEKNEQLFETHILSEQLESLKKLSEQFNKHLKNLKG